MEDRMMAKILLVAPHRQVRTLLADALSDQGFFITAVADGRSALFQFGMSQPDLVILDMALPDRDEMATLQRMRELSNVPIMMLAGQDEAANLDCLHLGADGYLVRPFSVRELDARVRALLRRSRRGVFSCRAALPAQE